jgi:hypothetical protein
METPGQKLICRGSRAGCDELRDGDMQATSLRMASAWQARLPLQSRAIEFYRGQRAVRRHRQPIEVVIEQPIPTGKIGISINSYQLVSVPVYVGDSIEPCCKLEAMQN